jgi:hypothetical protein
MQTPDNETYYGKEQRPQVTLGDDGVIRINFGFHARITRATVQDAHEQHRRLTPYRAPVLIKGEHVLTADSDAERYASSPEIVKAVTACALLPRTVLERVIARLFLRYSKPPYPVRVFADEDEAIEWLKPFVTTERLD